MYTKKNKGMGLDCKEKEIYFTSLIKYLQLKTELNDLLFDTHIMPLLLHGEAEDLYDEIYDLIGWKTEVMVYGKDIEDFCIRFEKIKDKDEFLNKVDLYYTILVDNLTEFLNEINNRDCFEDLCFVISNDNNFSELNLYDQLTHKFQILYEVLGRLEEGQINATVEKSSK